MNRRHFLQAILAAAAAPAIIRSGILMPTRQIITGQQGIVTNPLFTWELGRFEGAAFRNRTFVASPVAARMWSEALHAQLMGDGGLFAFLHGDAL